MNNKWRNTIYCWLGLLTIAIAILFYYFSRKNAIIQKEYETAINQSQKIYSEYTPFITYPTKADSLKNLTLTPEHLENIKKHIEFLNVQVDKAVSETKQEVNNDINRLNALVSWWIGILTIVGGLIPVFIGIVTKIDAQNAFDGKLKLAEKEASKAVSESKLAKEQADKATEKLERFEKDFSGLNTETKDAKQNADEALKVSKESKDTAINAENSAKEASKFATEAKNKVYALEKITNTTTALSKLRMLDAKKMDFIKNRLQYFTEQLELIEKQLRSTLDQEESFFMSDVVKDNLLSFYISLRSFRTLFKERNVTQAIVEFHSAMETELRKGMSKNVVNVITENLSELLKKLKEVN